MILNTISYVNLCFTRYLKKWLVSVCLVSETVSIMCHVMWKEVERGH